MNKAQKLVRMLDLMIRRGGVSATQLIERFDLEPRTLRRYLADLRGLDIPILDEGRGDDRLISLDPRWRRTGVQLTLAEVLSLHFGRTLFNFLDGTSFVEDIDGAIERLEPAISRAHANLARQLDARFLAVPEPAKDYRGTASEVLDEVITALVYNNPLDARYRKPSGVEGRYVLQPYTLATFRQGLYLFAYDTAADAVKTFAIERFVDVVRRRSEHFVLPADWAPESHIGHAFGIISGPPRRVVLHFSQRVATYIRERKWHRSQRSATLPDGGLELALNIAVTVELRSWVLGFGADVEVVQPPELRSDVAASLRRAAQRYGDV
jgi:predicted DNA-binding transcriptional regulator YafY